MGDKKTLGGFEKIRVVELVLVTPRDHMAVAGFQNRLSAEARQYNFPLKDMYTNP